MLKIGGSLMNSKELISWLNNIFSFASNSLIITVPGGGEFAENIRKMLVKKR